MNAPLLVSLDPSTSLAPGLAAAIGAEFEQLETRQFPDGETYLRFHTDLTDRQVILTQSLDRPNPKVLAVMFAARTARELGAREIGLVTPYLPYMRQDRRFHEGEAVTSNLFAAFLSGCVDWLVTVDPHLHRHPTLSSIYDVPTIAAHAAPLLSAWIAHEVNDPIVIGPDEESEQWAAEVARGAGAPHLVLRKQRLGDREVVVIPPDAGSLQGRTPVLVDDIVSTARTMIETVQHLRSLTAQPPVCMAVHGVFADGAEAALRAAGAGVVVTTNSICHATNVIDVTPVLADALRSLGFGARRPQKPAVTGAP